ncbi:SGNH/GDSL hydrolase family protein [Caulobacter segnis]|uniref:Uncharacterized protein n=1 Tax=Caulobacter segnis TaxID=88688 RepID=A0A2W5X6K1_9CAUL|nr:SGNH/GDSL hydrolase family protein [Caulobacter segnis]PZR36504.1 MAG: hypothetical protein DI526_03445 [Caulobacter segnis]
MSIHRNKPGVFARLLTLAMAIVIGVGGVTPAFAQAIDPMARGAAVYAARPPIVSVTATAAQPLATATDTLVSLNKTTINPANLTVSSSPAFVTIPTDGVYAVRGTVSFATNGTGARAAKIVSVNASGAVTKVHKAVTLDASAANPVTISLSATVVLIQGENVGLVVNQTSGGSLNTVAGATLDIERRIEAAAESLVVPGPFATLARALLSKQASAQPIGQMASPPTYSIGAANAVSTLTGAATTAPNVLATLSSTAVVTGSIPAAATSTASTISGYVFTPGGTITGSWAVGQVLSGSGVTAGTLIAKDNGNGTYQVDKSQSVASTAIKALGNVLIVTNMFSGANTLVGGVGLSGNGTTTGTHILAQISTSNGDAPGNRGTYLVSIQQDVASGSITASTPNPILVDRGGKRSATSGATGQYISQANLSASQTANNGWGIRFTVTGSAFDLAVGTFQNGQGTRLKCDGKWADTGKRVIPDSSNIFYQKWDFGTSATRVCEIWFDKDVYFRGLNVNAGGSITSGAFPAGSITAYFIGESYAAGALGGGASSNLGSETSGTVIMGGAWPFKMGEYWGWENVVTAANGGTGFLVNGTTRKYIERRNDPKRIGTPDVIVIATPINDWLNRTAGGDGGTATSAALLQAAVTAEIAAMRADYPNALILVFGPWRGKGDPTGSTYYDATQAATLAAGQNDPGVIYIDNQGWQNAGNDALYMDVDNTHPTTAGQTYLGYEKAGPALVSPLKALSKTSN